MSQYTQDVNILNNPGNIVKNGEHWFYEIEPSLDDIFKQFESLAGGYRACFVNLHSYINNGFNTIHKMVYKWCLTNPDVYVKHMVEWTGIGENQILTLQDGDLIMKLVAAIARQEYSINPPDWTNIQAGFDLQQSIKKKL